MPDKTEDPLTADAVHKRPRWVVIGFIVAALLVAAFIVLHLTGNSPSHQGHQSLGVLAGR